MCYKSWNKRTLKIRNKKQFFLAKKPWNLFICNFRSTNTTTSHRIIQYYRMFLIIIVWKMEKTGFWQTNSSSRYKANGNHVSCIKRKHQPESWIFCPMKAKKTYFSINVSRGWLFFISHSLSFNPKTHTDTHTHHLVGRIQTNCEFMFAMVDVVALFLYFHLISLWQLWMLLARAYEQFGEKMKNNEMVKFHF